MNKYHIRFNTKHSDTDLIWRVFENGKEHLVRNIHLNVPCVGERTIEDGVEKWNIACYGNMIISNDGIAIIN